jgi:hypothetical protein
VTIDVGSSSASPEASSSSATTVLGPVIPGGTPLSAFDVIKIF